jgi:uncharacterized protein with PQ loop repeat
MYLVMLSGVILWGVYGYLIGSKSVLIANAITALLQGAILFMILNSRKLK